MCPLVTTKENMMTRTRTLDLDTLNLKAGAHHPTDGEMCILEAVAYVAGERWSDHPECASQVIGAFLRTWNDALNDADRNRLLKPLIPKLVGTKGTVEQEDRRAWMAVDWLARDYTPVWLRLAHLDAQAELLAGLPEFRAGMDVPSIRPTLEAVRKDANAARAAAEGAAWAARAAAEVTARDAARDVLLPTVEALQTSALHLVERMIEVTA